MTFKARIEYIKNDLTPAQFNLLATIAEHPNGLNSNELYKFLGIESRISIIDSQVKTLLKTEELEIHVAHIDLDDGSLGWLWKLCDLGGE